VWSRPRVPLVAHTRRTRRGRGLRFRSLFDRVADRKFAYVTDRIEYLHLPPDATLPDVTHFAPFRAMLILEAPVSNAWRAAVSDWLVQSGCLFMSAWGVDCSSWDDSVDMANLEKFDYGSIPEDRFVMTTWHADESLRDAMSFCKLATHPVLDMRHTLLIHISEHGDERRVLDEYAAA
jgi:hypothetical protein